MKNSKEIDDMKAFGCGEENVSSLESRVNTL